MLMINAYLIRAASYWFKYFREGNMEVRCWRRRALAPIASREIELHKAGYGS